MVYRNIAKYPFCDAWISPFLNHVHIFEKIVGLTADDGMLFGAGSTLRFDTDKRRTSLSHHTKRAKVSIEIVAVP